MRGRLAGLAAVGTLLVSSCGFSLQSLPKIGAMSDPSYTITANFSNVVNLPAEAEVRVGSFQVGQVSAIGLNNFHAVVKMKIKRSVKLPTGTTASIAFDTPLGEDYVVLTEPTAKTTSYIAGGATLPDIGSPAPSVEDTFAALGALLNGGGIDQLQTIISQTDLAFGGNQQQIRALINNLNATVTSLADNTPAIDRALDAMAALTTTLHNGQAAITTGLQALGPAAALLGSESQAIDALFVNLNSLSNSANTVIDASLTGSISTFRQLGPLLDQLTVVQSQLDPALVSIKSLEAYTPRAVPGDYLQLAINGTIDLPPVPAGVKPVTKINVDPPESDQSYQQDRTSASVALLIGWGLP